MMAAQAMAPMPAQQQVLSLYQLSFDADDEIASVSIESAKNLPAAVLKQALPATPHPGVLNFYATYHVASDIVQLIVLNPVVSGHTLARICAKTSNKQILVIISNNQDRILSSPPIVTALYHNKYAPLSAVQKVLELVVRNNVDLDGIPELDAIKQGILSSDGAMSASADSTAQDECFDQVIAAGEKPAEESTRNLSSQQIKELPLFAKVRLATIGSSFHRSVLVKDRNRTVYMAAIRSPAVSEQEAIKFSGVKELEEDVIRYISTKREWHRNYSLKLNLVNNPKCPLPVALKLLAHLRQNDLRQIARSRSVPAVVARSAKQAMLRRS